MVFGAIVFLLPGAGLVAGRRLRRRALARQTVDVARMAQSGVWRFRPLWRWTGLIVPGLPLAGLLLAAVLSGDPSLLVVAIIFGGPFVAYGYLAAFRPRVELTPPGLVVVNPLSTRRVAWGDLVAAQPGYWGARLTRRDGSTLNVWAGQKTNWAVWLGRRARSDDMCQAIAERAHLVAGNLDPTIQLADPARPENRRRGLRNMAIGLAAYGLFLAIRSGLFG
ncbi:MAG: PH domain-containing protein [Actinobacteria bacterium]|nr:PH domain-containing protein [Actinomycetota bacterium]